MLILVYVSLLSAGKTQNTEKTVLFGARTLLRVISTPYGRVEFT